MLIWVHLFLELTIFSKIEKNEWEERYSIFFKYLYWLCCYCLVAKLYLTLCNLMEGSTPGSSVLHHLLEFAKFMFMESVMQSNHLILCCPLLLEKAMAPHSSTLAWKIPWMEEPGRLQSMGFRRVGHDWATSLSLFTLMHWRRKWQPTPVFLPGESQG